MSDHSTSGWVPLATVLALCAAAMASGCDVRSALLATGRAVGGAEGETLTRVVRRLDQGQPWDIAWKDSGRCEALARALQGSWQRGSSPQGPLEAAQQSVHRRSRRAAERAAARLGARLILPLTLCLLPAFVLVGIVPLVVVLAAGVIPALHQ